MSLQMMGHLSDLQRFNRAPQVEPFNYKAFMSPFDKLYTDPEKVFDNVYEGRSLNFLGNTLAAFNTFMNNRSTYSATNTFIVVDEMALVDPECKVLVVTIGPKDMEWVRVAAEVLLDHCIPVEMGTMLPRGSQLARANLYPQAKAAKEAAKEAANISAPAAKPNKQDLIDSAGSATKATIETEKGLATYGRGM